MAWFFAQSSQNGLPVSAYDARKNYIKAVGKGVLKVMSKMGISTYQSYCGAQIFDAVGLNSAVIEQYFTGTATTIEGIGLHEIAVEAVQRPCPAKPSDFETGLRSPLLSWRLRALRPRCACAPSGPS